MPGILSVTHRKLKYHTALASSLINHGSRKETTSHHQLWRCQGAIINFEDAVMAYNCLVYYQFLLSLTDQSFNLSIRCLVMFEVIHEIILQKCCRSILVREKDHNPRVVEIGPFKIYAVRLISADSALTPGVCLKPSRSQNKLSLLLKGYWKMLPHLGKIFKTRNGQVL